MSPLLCGVRCQLSLLSQWNVSYFCKHETWIKIFSMNKIYLVLNFNKAGYNNLVIGLRIKRMRQIFVPMANHFICDRGSVISFCGFLLFDRRLISHLFDKRGVITVFVSRCQEWQCLMPQLGHILWRMRCPDPVILQSLEPQPKLGIYCYIRAQAIVYVYNISCESMVPFIF